MKNLLRAGAMALALFCCPMAALAQSASQAGEPRDLRAYAGCEIQVSGLSGGDTITVSRSFDNAHWTVQTVIGADFTSSATIAIDGIYSLPAAAFVKWSKTGTASTPTALIRAQ